MSRMYEVVESQPQAVERCISSTEMTGLELTGKRDILAKLAKHSKSEVEHGTYNGGGGSARQCEIQFSMPSVSQRMATIISEIKFASPSRNTIRPVEDPAKLAVEMVNGGAAALSVLTQPYLFKGSPEYFLKARKAVSVPMLMKDVVVDRVQVEAAGRMGADCILLMQAVFDEGYASGDIGEFIDMAHDNNVQVLLEVRNKTELKSALSTKCDVIGVNNRNLDTLEISLDTTKSVLEGYNDDRPVVSESGIKDPSHIRYLSGCGADAFLVGTAIMGQNNVRESVRALVESL